MLWKRRRMPIVNFLIAGVQKGGTSSLDAWLRQHPQVCMARKKEVHYFDFDDRWRNDRWYHRYFSPTSSHRAVGEATPIYTYAPEAARRIWEYNRDMRLIVLLRDPVERAWSHWRMEHAEGRDALPFGEAVRRDIERSRANLPTHHRVYSYTDRGFYSEQIRRLRRFFPDVQLLFIKSEKLFADPVGAMIDVCRFLGLDAHSFDTSRAHRVGPTRESMSDEHRRYLLDTYRHDIAEVERLLGWDCGDWRCLAPSPSGRGLG